MPRTETIEQKAIRRSRARLTGITGLFVLALGLFFFIPAASMLAQSQQAAGTIISNVEQGSGKSARSFTTVEYNGNQYDSNQMNYRNAMGLGKSQDIVELSILPDNSVEITKAIKLEKTKGIIISVVGILFIILGWFFGWKPYFEEKKAFRFEHESKHEK